MPIHLNMIDHKTNKIKLTSRCCRRLMFSALAVVDYASEHFRSLV